MIKEESRLWPKGEELYSFDLWLTGAPTRAFHSVSRAAPTLSLQYLFLSDAKTCTTGDTYGDEWPNTHSCCASV